MVKCYKDGIFDALGGAPHLTVHDELDLSHNIASNEALEELKYTLESTTRLKVPLMVDISKGPNWGSLDEQD